jgi:vacuolar protein sorting-associated protein 35
MIEQRPLVDEEMALDTALKNIRCQNYQIMLQIEKNDLRFCLKQTFILLCELRTNILSPKNYLALYSQVFNELIPLFNYMNVEISRGREPWDIYESVQQCRYVIPRLYLVILSGACYIEHSPEKCKEILEDLLELTKEAQSPIRGIFVRYFLIQMLKGRLPDGDNKFIKQGKCTIKDTTDFLIKNFEEMNRAWIRMTLNASIEERPILEKERDDSKKLIHDAIEMFTQLEDLNMELYEKEILPKLIEIIFMYDDYISQEYIMECILTLFPESYNIKNLDFLLLTISKLIEGVNTKKLFIIVLEKLNNYFQENSAKSESEEKTKKLNEVYGAYPVILRNYNIILNKQSKQVENINNVLEINQKFIKFCVNCAPEEEKLISINHGINLTVKTIYSMNVSMLFQEQLSKIYDILSVPLESIYSLFDMPDFPNLFSFLDYESKKKLSLEIIQNLINPTSHEKLDSLEKIQQLLVFLKPLIKNMNEDNEENAKTIEKEQYALIKLFNVFKTNKIELVFKFYEEFKNFLKEEGKIRRMKSFPCLISYLINFSKDITNLYENKNKENKKYDISVLNTDDDFCDFIIKIFLMLDELIKIMQGDEPKMAMNYSFLVMNQINKINTSKEKFVDLCVSFFNNCMELFKKFSEDKKYEIFNDICQNLLNNKLFSNEFYENIINDLFKEAKNMKKRSEQFNCLLMISQLYYNHFKDGKKVYEFLSKAKKIADFSLSNQRNLILFVILLNKYLYYIESDKENIVEISKDMISELIDDINNYIITIKTDKNIDASFLPEIEKFYKNTLDIIIERKNKENHNKIYDLIEIENNPE